jgi:hypothetical protein
MTATERKEKMIQDKAIKREGSLPHEKWALRERKEVFKLTYGVDTFSKVLELFRADYKHNKNRAKENIYELYIKYSQAIFFLYSASSVRNNLVKFKKVIEAEKGRQMKNALDIFTVKGVYKPIAKRDHAEKIVYHEAQKEDHGHYKTHEELSKQIKEIKEKIDKRSYNVAKNQKEDKVRAYHLAILIGLVTGRRFSEVIKTLELSSSRGTPYYHGLLKGSEAKIRAYFIDLSYREVNSYLKELRKLLDTTNIEVDKINTKYSRVFNNAIVKIAGIKSFKKMRDDYAQVASKIFNQSIDEVLGHKEIITSGVNYTK